MFQVVKLAVLGVGILEFGGFVVRVGVEKYIFLSV